MYMRGCLFRFWMGRCPRRLVATALMLFACSSASLKALTLPGVSWSAVYEFTNGLYLDESGNGNTLSAFTGSPAFVPDRSGSSSSAFLGSTGTILGRSGALVGFNPLSNQLSLSAWIKTSSSGKEVIATMGRNLTNNDGEWIWGISSGKLYFWDYRGGYGFVETSVSTTSVNNGQWRHVAFVRNELTGTFYVDGTPAGTVTAIKNVSYTNSDLAIGGDYRDGTLHWTGQLDDISVTSTALTPAQILLLAVDADGDGLTDAQEQALGTNPTVSQIPDTLITKQSGASGFVATWGAVIGAAGYEVQVSTEPTFSSGLIGGDRPVSLGTTTSLGITGISGQIRYYRVRSVFPSLGEPVKTAWSPAVSAPDLTAFGKYATLNATGNADSFQAAVGSSANNNSYTISFWMRPDRLGGVSGSENVQVFRQPINNNASAANVDIDLLPDGSLVFGQRSEAGEEHFVSTPADAVLPGNWVHVTAVRDAANAALRLYINGVEIAAKTLAFGTSTWNIVNSGGPGATQAALNNDSNANRIRAAFDDVRIYRAVRTPVQILEGMSMPLNKIDANSTANTSLVFYAPLEGTSLSSTDANSFYKGTLNGSGSGTITSQAVLTEPILTWTPSPINLVPPAVLSTIELTATATAPTGGPVSGSWSYLPAAGTSLSNGTNEVVGTFVPTDLVTYAIGTITNQIVVTEPSYSVPGVETGPTNSISGLTQTSVKLVGGITNLGGTTVTNAGFYLNTNSMATNGVKYSAPGTSFGLGSFSNTITGLTPGTSYYYRAFAANSVGTGYGTNEYSFTTPSPSPFTYTNNGTGLTITGYTGTGGVVEIPATIGGVAVTTIGQNAFQSKTSVTSVVIPNGVTTILDAAFAGCSGMTAITLPNSLTSIGGYVFDGCSSLQSITIPDGVTSIGPNAFAFCTSLPSITLPSGLNKIMSGTFWTCTNLTSITIPSSVNEIQYNAFLNCSKLASVNFLGNTPPTFGSPTPFGGVATGAKGYYPAMASSAWASLTQIGGLTIVHPDTQPPVITLIGANPLTIYKGSAFTDPGATVTDNRDVTRSITGTGTVITATVGNYTRTYNATDAAGNLAVLVTRTVNVVLDPSGDEDGDGVNNGAESSAGTNPLVKNILRFQTIDMLALGKGNFSIAESNGGGGAPVGFRYGTPAYYGGVPFFITDQSNQVWHAARAPGGNGTGVVSETFPIAVNNVYGFYTLAGLWWGVAGSYVTYTFNFSDGSSYSKGLINNVDLRDYNIPSSFANSINGTTTQNVFFSGNYHLDRQWIDFAAAGHGGKNLVSFTVTDRGASGSSRIFLAAATAQVGAPGQIPPGATDTDGDGILDNYELGLPLSTKPDDADTDDDGLSDGTEISGTTDPLVADFDNDGLKDGVEFAIGTNPLVADSDGDGTPDGDEDADNDGGSNRIEVGLGNSLTVANVYNRLINGSFEDGTVKPSPGGNLPTHQNNVPGWKTTASNNFIIELWYSGFLGSSGNVGNTLAELNYIASGTLYQDVTMTVNSPVSYSFLHRGRDGSDVMDFKIDELSGGPGTSVVNNKFTRRVTTGTSWIRYSGSQATEVEAGKTYRFSYTSISPTGGNGNLLDDASFGIDQDADGLLDYEETDLGTNPLLSDTDGDGFSDGVEVKAGSSPTSADGTPLPEIVADPVGATKEFGQSYRFEVLASGTGLTYQWKRDGQNVIGGSNPYLELASLTVSDSGSYSVTVSNSYGSVTSSPVYLSVTQALISSGFSHSLYLATGATTVMAWGVNSDGRLGVGDMNSPVNWAKTVQGIPVGVTVDGLSAGGTHSLILAGGEVYAAGSDRFGQLGQGAVNGANKTSFTSVVIPSSTPVAVSAGGNHSLIVTAAGEVFACGDNTYGQLAQPDTTLSSGTLVEVNFPGLTTRIVSAAAGADHNLAVDENGGVWVWGRNDSGQLGKNTRTSADRTPVRILSSGAKSLAAGYAHSLILKQDGSVLGFGRNTLGQTGQSSGTSYAKLPIPIPGLSGIRLISAGTDSSFAIDGAGQLRSWGYNAYGELLLGNANPSSSAAVYGPTPSPIATNVFNVSGGGYSSLAVGAQGVIFGGRNDVGQSGNGPDPEQVVGDYNYIGGDLGLGNLTMDLAGTTETLYDQIFVGSGTATLNGILNLMFVGTYSGPVYGSTQTFDLIWAKNGIVFGAGYQIAFNQSGYLAETERVAKDGGEVLRATIRAVVTASDLAKAVDLARPSLDGVESVSYGGSTGLGLRTLSVSPGVEMIYSYERPTGGVSSGAQYFVNGITYRVEQVSSLTGAWGDALVSGTTVTPVGNGYERATLRISSSGGAGFLRLQVENPQANGINAGVGSAITY